MPRTAKFPVIPTAYDSLHSRSETWRQEQRNGYYCRSQVAKEHDRQTERGMRVQFTGSIGNRRYTVTIGRLKQEGLSPAEYQAVLRQYAVEREVDREATLAKITVGEFVQNRMVW